MLASTDSLHAKLGLQQYKVGPLLSSCDDDSAPIMAMILRRRSYISDVMEVVVDIAGFCETSCKIPIRMDGPDCPELSMSVWFDSSKLLDCCKSGIHISLDPRRAYNTCLFRFTAANYSTLNGIVTHSFCSVEVPQVTGAEMILSVLGDADDDSLLINVDT